MERKDSTTSRSRGELLDCRRKCVRATPNHRSAINSERLLDVFMCRISFNNNFETITFNTFSVTGFAVRIRYVGRGVIFSIGFALPGKPVVARSYRFVRCSYVPSMFFSILKNLSRPKTRLFVWFIFRLSNSISSDVPTVSTR